MLAIVATVPETDIVTSLSCPTVRPESFNTPKVPLVVSPISDLNKLEAEIVTPLSFNAAASEAIPLNLFDDIDVESVIPLKIVANPPDVSAAPFVPVPGVNSSADTTNTTESPVTPFKIDLLTPVFDSTTSGTIDVTPEPATEVGPIKIHDVPLYVYNCLLVVSNHISPKTALDG